jgi:hypothetical protein
LQTQMLALLLLALPSLRYPQASAQYRPLHLAV